MSHLDTGDVEKRLREKSDAIALKQQWIHVSLVISFATFPVKNRPASRVGSGGVTAFVGRVGSGLEIWTRVQLWATIDWKSAISLQRGPLTNNSGRRGRPPPTIFSQESRLNDLSYSAKKICTDFFSFCHKSHVWQKDGQTDGQTPLSRLDRPAFNAAR